MDLRERIQLYGTTTTAKIAVKTLFRPFVKISEFEVLIIENHRCNEDKKVVKSMTLDKLNYWKDRGEIDTLEYDRFYQFINTDCSGYYIEVNGNLAAWGFVQNKGTYKYGTYFFDLPKDVYILKNLFVKSNYRGISLGKELNNARINDIPDGCIPCVFVLPENRYALRNLELYGFKKTLKIRHISVFKYVIKSKIDMFNTGEINCMLVKGFQTIQPI